jgi:aminopeptidase N
MFLLDNTLRPGMKAYLLQIDEASLERRFVPLYRERYAVRRRLMRTVAQAVEPDLFRVFGTVDTFAKSDNPKDGFENRRLKAVLLHMIAAADTPAAWRAVAAHFRSAWHITDRASALHALLQTDSPDRMELLQEALDLWKDHLNGYTTWLRLLGSGRHADAFDRVAEEERQPRFRREHPTHSRALYLPMAANNGLLWSERGLDWFRRTVTEQAGINENTALRIASALQMATQLPDDLRPDVLRTLERIRSAIDATACPALAGRLDAYLGKETRS